jgi:hypothetical protein
MQTTADVICNVGQSPRFAKSANVRAVMDEDTKSPETKEFEELLAASQRSQVDVAAYLSRRLRENVPNYQVSRWASGRTKVTVAVMDAMRELVAQPADAAAEIAALTETADVVPLFGYANAAGSVLRLNEDQRVGVVPIHPAQRGSRSALAFIVFGDSLSPMLNHGDVGYAIRGRTPRKGQPCLIELTSGETMVKLFAGTDERTLFVEQLTPKKEITFPLRELQALHAVVGVTFG